MTKKKLTKRALRKRKSENRSKLINFSILAFVIGIIGLLVWVSTRPAEGKAIPIAKVEHVADGVIINYASNPPSSGTHYSKPMPAGFYTENSLEYLAGNGEGYLVHGLEHGYITFWYNCDILTDKECADLMLDIQESMDEFGNFKVVAWPWKSIDFPLVLTSWGQELELKEFDSEAISKFITRNSPRAPEPNAN